MWELYLHCVLVYGDVRLLATDDLTLDRLEFLAKHFHLPSVSVVHAAVQRQGPHTK